MTSTILFLVHNLLTFPLLATIMVTRWAQKKLELTQLKFLRFQPSSAHTAFFPHLDARIPQLLQIFDDLIHVREQLLRQTQPQCGKRKESMQGVLLSFVTHLPYYKLITFLFKPTPPLKQAPNLKLLGQLPQMKYPTSRETLQILPSRLLLCMTL